MQMLQIRSIDRELVATGAVDPLLGLLSRAAAMGLLPEASIDHLDAKAVGGLFDRLQDAGLIGLQRARIDRVLDRHALREPGGRDAGAALRQVIELIEESPVPPSEWPSMRAIFSDEALAALLRISASSLRRYSTADRSTPAEIADRLHWLAMVVADLAGSYNELGIARWFERVRSQLDGLSPRAALAAQWTPDDALARRVRALAASVAHFGAT